MAYRTIASLLALLFTAACTTPYKPPVLAHGSQTFPGLVGLLEAYGHRPVDVLLVHGMCTHDQEWANGAIDALARAVDSHRMPFESTVAPSATRNSGIQIVTRSVPAGGGTLRFSALVWSPLTTPLKSQLEFDQTGKPSDCAAPGECKPERARLNGSLKDGLMNDCLADALIYQGVSQPVIQQAMVDAISYVLRDSAAEARRAGEQQGPLVLVSESLGSKLAFDALVQMASEEPLVKGPPSPGVERLALIFMGANQLPILGLADQVAEPQGRLPAGAAPPMSSAPTADSLQLLLRQSRSHKEKQRTEVPDMAKAVQVSDINIVAFTDPNDLLSYRLQPSKYAGPKVIVSDVLVSNTPTYFGLFAWPPTAHTEYRSNSDVASLIACGNPRSQRCR